MAKILFFGKLSDVASEMDVTLPKGIDTTDDLKRYLGDSSAALQDALDSPGVFVAVNKEIVRENTLITDADEIAFMSALSGG